jgi:streptogramin lyase
LALGHLLHKCAQRFSSTTCVSKSRATEWLGMAPATAKKGASACARRGAHLSAHGFTATLALLALLLFPAAADAAAPAGSVVEFPIPSNESEPTSIAPGPEGSEWFTEEKADKIGRIALNGTITEFPVPTPEGAPAGIALGAEGNLWFTEHKGNEIGRITPSGAITEYALITPESGPEQITPGPGGNLWFTENGLKGEGQRIGRITPAGYINEFETPTAKSGPFGITAGSDGNVWFTEQNKGDIGRITPSGSITEFEVSGGGGPRGIAAGPDGNLWFTEQWGDKIGRISPAGTISEYTLPFPITRPNGIVAGPDGNLWFTLDGEKVIVGGKEEEVEASRIGRISPTGEPIVTYPTSIPRSGPEGIAPGADGNMWFTESRRNNVGVAGTGVPGPLLAALTVSGNHEAGSPQSCGASWASWASLQPSTSIFGFDGYQWLLGGSLVGIGPSYTPTSANIGGQLSCSETVTYPLLDVTAATASTAVAVIPPPPTLAAAKESKSKWREGKQLAQISARRKRASRGHGKHKHHKRQPPVGTVFSFALSEQAAMTFTFTQRVGGREVAHKCVAKTHKNRKHEGCTRTVVAGTLSFTGHEGLNHVSFAGRLSRSRKLTPGGYTLTITAANSTGPAAPASLYFTIVK